MSCAARARAAHFCDFCFSSLRFATASFSILKLSLAGLEVHVAALCPIYSRPFQL